MTREAAHFSARAGEWSVHNGALRDGIALLGQALALHERLGSPALVRARLERMLLSAEMALGRLGAAIGTLRRRVAPWLT
jgi:hypothetical protein